MTIVPVTHPMCSSASGKTGEDIYPDVHMQMIAPHVCRLSAIRGPITRRRVVVVVYTLGCLGWIAALAAASKKMRSIVIPVYLGPMVC